MKTREDTLRDAPASICTKEEPDSAEENDVFSNTLENVQTKEG